jgi:hypothetical protein
LSVTLTQAQAHLDAWLAADLAVASNQSYSMNIEGNQRQLTRADAEAIKKNIDYWSSRVERLTQLASGRGRTAVRIKN